MNKYDYRVAIASRGRNGAITTVEACGIDPALVDVFVDGADAVKLYKRSHPDLNIVDSGTSGISEVRNAMLDYYGVGKRIVMMCDDVRNVLRLVAPKRMVPVKGADLDKFIRDAFKLIDENGTKLWGVYPVNNHFYMSQSVASGFIICSFAGMEVSGISFPEEMRLKEDYAFTAEHIRAYHKVARFNNVTVDAVHYRNAGGCQEYRNADLEEQACQYLLTTYPWCVQRHPRRDGEVILKFKKAGAA